MEEDRMTIARQQDTVELGLGVRLLEDLEDAHWPHEKRPPNRMEKPSELKTLSELTKASFYTSYLVLFGYTTITLVEAIRTPSAQVRHIMNIETAISLVAGMVYSYFNEEVRKPGVDLKAITQIRYVDWSITTPLILKL